MNTIPITWMTLYAAAQNAAGGTESASSLHVQSIWDFVIKGGSMMIPIGICSLIALAVIIERAISLRKDRVIPGDLVAHLEKQVTAGDRLAALDQCRRNGSPLANIFETALRKIDEPLDRLEKRIQEAGEREIFNLRKYLRVLAVIAAVSPLLGLLGTVFGMIEAFQTVAVSAEALGKTEMLAKGIYEAMITTAAGLMVTIPTLIGYHWISARVDRLVLEMDRITVAFVEEHGSGADSRPAGVTRETRVEADEEDEALRKPSRRDGVRAAPAGAANSPA